MSLWTVTFRRFDPDKSMLGWEKRAVAGDVGVFRVGDVRHKVPPTTRIQSKVIMIEGPELEQIPGLEEAIWDTTFYTPYKPMDEQAFNVIHKSGNYQQYLDVWELNCSLPIKYLNKRRFQISKELLKDTGSGDVIEVTDITDKFKGRQIAHTDLLKAIAPLTVPEMIARANGRRNENI